jgi:hypothetical protein
VDRVGKVSLGMILGNSGKCRCVGGICEVEMKSMKSTKMKRQQLYN